MDKLTNNDKAAMKVESAIARGAVLVAYDALSHADTSVGSYVEAVNRGIQYAVINRSYHHNCYSANEAAASFVSRVGSTRAREVASKWLKSHGV